MYHTGYAIPLLLLVMRRLAARIGGALPRRTGLSVVRGSHHAVQRVAARRVVSLTAVSTAAALVALSASASPSKAEAEAEAEAEAQATKSDANDTPSLLPEVPPGADLLLLQYETCPFCCKVKAFLDFHRVPHALVEVDPIRRKELAFSKAYRKVPVAVLSGGRQVNNSADIIRAVNERGVAEGRPRFRPLTDEDDRWMAWADERLVKLLPPNIYRTPAEALEAFGYISEHGKFSAWQRGTIRYAGAAAMFFVARKKKKEYGITDERQALFDALGEWSRAVGDRPFLGGATPGAADLAVFGVLSSVRKFSVWDDVRAAAPEADAWYARVEAEVRPGCSALQQ